MEERPFCSVRVRKRQELCTSSEGGVVIFDSSVIVLLFWTLVLSLTTYIVQRKRFLDIAFSRGDFEWGVNRHGHNFNYSCEN